MKSLTNEMNTGHPARNWKHRRKNFQNELLITVVYGFVTGINGYLSLFHCSVPAVYVVVMLVFALMFSYSVLIVTAIAHLYGTTSR